MKPLLEIVQLLRQAPDTFEFIIGGKVTVDVKHAVNELATFIPQAKQSHSMVDGDPVIAFPVIAERTDSEFIQDALVEFESIKIICTIKVCENDFTDLTDVEFYYYTMSMIGHDGKLYMGPDLRHLKKLTFTFSAKPRFKVIT